MTPASTIGFLGLGTMGQRIAMNIRSAGYELLVYDIDEARTRPLLEVGATAPGSVEAVVRDAGVICTSLPHPPVFVRVAQEEILPRVAAGTVVIDFGTTLPSEARRLAAEFSARGAELLDSPVSGGPGGAEKGTMRVFAGGERTIFERVLPLLHVVGDPDRVVYCGESGSGQIVKAANQMLMGLVNAAVLESMSVALREGISADLLEHALGGEKGLRSLASGILSQIRDGAGDSVGVKSVQLGDYAREAARAGWRVPLADAVAAFLKDAPLTVVESNRPSPSFLSELLKSGDSNGVG
jgi:3-hydroxyisobutyrate dehydrogenase-like beta-hydroxyacid dehydrogenase